MKVTKTTYPGWSQYPCYHVRTHEDYHEVMGWCSLSATETFLLSSGSSGYVFQIKDNQDWFELRWS